MAIVRGSEGPDAAGDLSDAPVIAASPPKAGAEEHSREGPFTASDRRLLWGAKRLRLERGLLDILLLVMLGGSVAAIGAVHPNAYVPLWVGSLLTAVVALSSVTTAHRLRQRLGPRRLEIHPSGRWIVVNSAAASGGKGWTFDLGRPDFRSAPLLVPGLAFVVLVLVQIIPLPKTVADLLSAPPTTASGNWQGLEALGLRGWRATTLSVADTLRGLAFLGAAILVHLSAAVALRERVSRRRLRRGVALLALVVALVALVQMSSNVTRIYGLFESWEGGRPFGPFVNRNHFATWMVMAIALSLALVDRALGTYRQRLGATPNLRRRLVALQSSEGSALVYALIPAAAGVASLLASTSRGGIIAFGVGLTLALVGRGRSRGVPAWAVALAFVAMTLTWFGVERIGARFVRSENDAQARTRVWADSFSRMDGLWVIGSGFNTFGASMGRVAAWRLPEGATPWPEAARAELESTARVGYLSIEELRGLGWYREAHNDYIQVLVETGLVGLGIALWAAMAALAAARRDPWVLAAVAGVLLHAMVDFGLQIPAVALFFVIVTALPAARDT